MSSGKKGEKFPYKALVDLYEPVPAPSSRYWEALAEGSGGSTRSQSPWSAGKLFTGISGLAAAAVLIILLIPRSLGLPVTLADGTVPSGIPTESGLEFKAGAGELRLATRGERIILYPGAEMRVEPLGSGTAFHPPGNRYLLESGQMEVDHQDPSTTFEVRTPFGAITPLGTALKVQVTQDSLLIQCLKGRILFRSTEGMERILEAGSSLAWPEAPPQAGQSSATGPSLPEIATGNEAVPKRDTREEETTGPSLPRSAESPGPALKELWNLPLEDPLEEGTWVSGVWILRTARTALAVEGATGKVLSRWEPASPLWTVRDGQLADILRGKLQMWSGEGHLLWEVAAPPLSQGRLGAGPSGLWAASADGSLTAFSPEDGTQTRKFPLGTGSYGEPVEWGGQILVSTLDRRFSSLDVRSGTRKWSTSLPERLVGDRPTVWDRQVLVKDRTGSLRSLDLESGKILWSVETGNTLQPGVLALPDRLFIRTSGESVLVNAQGQDLGWAGGTVLAVLSMGGNRFLTAEPDGLYLNVAGSRETYREEKIRGAFSHGKSLGLQGPDGRLRMMVRED